MWCRRFGAVPPGGTHRRSMLPFGPIVSLGREVTDGHVAQGVR